MVGAEGLTRIVGRVEEQGALRAAVEGAARSRPSAVFVHGEAGVGKTTLVRRACEAASRDGFAVLWGQCVRFGAASSPYRPLLNALRRWRDADETEHRRARLAGIRDVLDEVPPEDAVTAGQMLPRLERTLLGLAEERPTVLVIDDAQWADLTSLDLVGLLIAGFGGQRLTILVTYRDEDLEPGHAMHGWLADLRRLPDVATVEVSKLGPPEIRDLVLAHGVIDPPPALVTEVHRRSGGNTYLAELLVKDIPPGTTELPTGLAPALREVLLARWHRLSAPARAVMSALAIGGRPYGQDDLTEVAGELGVDPDAVGPALVEAAELSVLDVVPGARYWFHHPLLAEVLGDMPPARAADLHAAFARLLESRTGADPADTRLSDLALHHERAGNPNAAFGHLLQAAEQARTARAYPEELGYLVRAEQLWPSVDPGARGPVEQLPLLEAAATAARRCLDLPAVHQLTARALDLVDREARPLEAARVLLAHTDVRMTSTDSDSAFALIREAVELSSGAPDSVEHALALADLAEASAWRGELEDARRHADRAVATAARSRSEVAQAAGLLARAFAAIPDPQALEDAEEGYRLAVESGLPEWIERATVTRANHYEAAGALDDQLASLLEGLEASRESGGTASAIAACAAEVLLDLGDLPGAGDMLRGAFGPRRGFWGGAMAHLVATRLACRTGARDQARHHLARADELVEDLAGFVGLHAPVAIAEHHLFLGEPQAAVEVLREGMVRHRADDSGDLMLVWGVRAAADLADRARDRHDPVRVAAAVDTLAELVEVRTGLPPTMFTPGSAADVLAPMRHSLFLAEAARCRGEPSAALWRAAASACAAAGCRYDEALALWRLAGAVLTEGGSRASAAAALRDANAYATAVGAAPLRAEIDALARIARLTLAMPRPVDLAEDTEARTALAALSPRELEVLALLVVGRTYAEIADELFISIKTVSAHVSHLLRKTDTSNRVEAAALGRRLGLGDRQPESAPTASLR